MELLAAHGRIVGSLQVGPDSPGVFLVGTSSHRWRSTSRHLVLSFGFPSLWAFWLIVVLFFRHYSVFVLRGIDDRFFSSTGSPTEKRRSGLPVCSTIESVGVACEIEAPLHEDSAHRLRRITAFRLTISQPIQPSTRQFLQAFQSR